MSDTCIVCLGDLGDGVNELPLLAGATMPSLSELDGPADADVQLPTPGADDTVELIAHLLPCGHNLHNECLKPWVERANSCPICRQNFNLVELSDAVGGKHHLSIPISNIAVN
jgi:hypothetical protein